MALPTILPTNCGRANGVSDQRGDESRRQLAERAQYSKRFVACSFAHRANPHLEIAEVVRVDEGVGVGGERAAVVGRQEEGVVRVEYLLGEDLVELPCHAAGVDPLLAGEVNREAPAHLVRAAEPQLVVGILEDGLAADIEPDRAIAPAGARALLTQERREVLPLHVKVEERPEGLDLHERAQALVEQARRRAHERVQDHSARVFVVRDMLERCV